MPDENIEEVNVEKLQEDLDTMTGNYKRALADFENYKRRQEQEGAELVDFVRTDMFRKLLPVIDSLGQALKHVPEVGVQAQEEFTKTYKNWVVGIQGIVMQLDQAFLELGVKKIESVGTKFDPHIHEAVKEVEGGEEGVVAEELQAGFMVHGKLIRPSQVGIYKKVE